MRGLLFALVVVVFPCLASAQPPEPLFIERSSVAVARDQGVRSRGVVEQSVVGMRLDRLFDRPDGAAARIVLNVGAETWTARLERVDHESNGFRSWVGVVEGIPNSHVVFTERDSIVSGLINTVDTTYQLRTQAANTYLLERINTSALGDELEPLDSGTTPLRDLPPADNPTASDDGSTIDVLMLYTANARGQRGGTPQMEAVIAQIVSDTNTAFVRSGVNARMRLVGAQEVSLVEAPFMSLDLESLRYSATVRAGRDLVRADLVQLLVSSPDQNACGYGYLLDSLNESNFDAYSVADVACVAQYTPTHEMAHNMGSHHAPEDGAFGGLFPYSYGYKDPARGFRTIMAYGCSGGVVCSRILNFSNPLITHLGSPTGTPLQDNARSINEASFTVANFRQSTLPPQFVVTGLRSSVIGNLVHLAWDAVATASSYLLQVGRTPGAADVFNGVVLNLTSVSGVVPDGTYHWRVYAQNVTGNSPASAESAFTVGASCTIPGPPRNFMSKVDQIFPCPHCAPVSIVTLSWSAPLATGNVGSTAAAYTIEAGSTPGGADLYRAVTGPHPEVIVQAPRGAYFVRVRANNACGTSAPSNEQLIVVP